MVANEDEMARNIALARELYYSGKLGPMGPSASRSGPPRSLQNTSRKLRRRSSTGSISVNCSMPFNKWSMEILQRECKMEIVVPLSRRRSDIATSVRGDPRRREELKQASRHSLGSESMFFCLVDWLNRSCLQLVYQIIITKLKARF